MNRVSTEDVAKDHILRAQLPWRKAWDALTECGLPAKAHSVLDYTHFIAKVEQQGQQRAAMSTCMTCWQGAERHQRSYMRPKAFQPPTLISIFHRELDRVRWSEERDGAVLRKELYAIAALIEAHQEEFDQRVAGMEGVVFIGDIAKTKK